MHSFDEEGFELFTIEALGFAPLMQFPEGQVVVHEILVPNIGLVRDTEWLMPRQHCEDCDASTKHLRRLRVHFSAVIAEQLGRQVHGRLQKVWSLANLKIEVGIEQQTFDFEPRLLIEVFQCFK